MDVEQLERELRTLQSQRVKVEQRLKTLRLKEKQQAAKRTSQQKRTRESRDQGEDQSTEDHANKKSRLSSVVQPNLPQEDATVKPKLTSAIVSTGEKPPAAGKEVRQRDRKLFGTLLLGTLQRFKSEQRQKSVAASRREQIEQKIEAKVEKERESFLEQQARSLQEAKEKELALRDEIKKKQETKELELLTLKWQLHRTQLSKFFKTETTPCIYYKPSPKTLNEKAPQTEKTEPEANEKNEGSTVQATNDAN